MIQLSGKWEKMIAYQGLTEEDLSLLHRYQEFFEQYAEGIVDQFYEEVGRSPEMLNIILRHSSIRRLKQTQIWYLKSLGSNTIDAEYIQGREQIGRVHARIQLPLPWYLGGYSIYVRLIQARMTAIPEADVTLFYTAVVKRLIFDSSVVSEQYHTNIVNVTEQLANYDLLTDVPNRQHFMRLLDKHRKDEKYPFALLFIDLDSFKEVNDTLGHEVGDEVLRVIARRMQKCVRPDDALGRLGGDEFIMFISDLGSAEEAKDVANRLLSVIQQEIIVGHQRIRVTASIGIALLYFDKNKSPTEVIRDSDLAMYKAKRSGKNRYHLAAL